MKKAGYIVSALGVAVIIFAIVCFISAGSLLNEIEQYLGGYMEADDVLDMALETGLVESDFRVFAYQARVWLLVGGLVMLAAGAVMIFVGRKKAYGSYGGQYAPVYEGYDEYDDAAKVTRHEDAASVICPVCGTACGPDAAFCRNCGATMKAPEPSGRICHACGAENDADANFCRECGQKLDAEAFSETSSVSEKTDWEAFRPDKAVDTAEAEAAEDEDTSYAAEAEVAESEDALRAAEAEAAEEDISYAVEAEAAESGAVFDAEASRVEAETVSMETEGVFRKSDSFSAPAEAAKPAGANPFLRKAGDL